MAPGLRLQSLTSLAPRYDGDMSEPEAYLVAEAYVRQLGATYYRCFSSGVDTDFDPSPLVESDLPPGCRPKVWSFAFTFVEDEPGTITSGGGGVVFVDDQTGACGYFASL
jgi:hypothetical protein